MALTIKDYEAVLALADERHFGRAARKLKVSQPALSSRLYRIEAELETRLFERSPQGVLETVEGQALCEYARRVLEAHEEAQLRVKEARHGFGVALRIGATQLAIHQVLIPALRAFRQSFAEARVRLYEGTTFQMERDLENGTLDVAFLHPPIHVPGLSQRVLTSTYIVLVDFADDRAATGCVIQYPRNEAPVMMGALERQIRDHNVNQMAIANTAMTSLALSAAGYGAAFVTEDLPDLGFGQLDAHKSERLMELETSVVFRTTDRRPVIRAFLDCIPE